MLSTPEILSHAIHETLLFDKVLREDELYIPPGQTTEWQGTVQVYLGNREWLRTWLRVEKDCKYPIDMKRLLVWPLFGS
jgi:hypothetical protein